MSGENLTRIFQHGFTTKAEGHGFGLHSAALAAEEMGGTLTAENTGVDCGATFTLELPLRPGQEADASLVQRHASRPDDSGSAGLVSISRPCAPSQGPEGVGPLMTARRHRILVVDDNPTIHEDFRKILAAPVAESSGEINDLEQALFGGEEAQVAGPHFALDSAHQGQEALACVEQARASGHPYAMAFVDLRMPPGWDGIETIERLWVANPTLQAVVCTAYSDYSWESRSSSA